MNTVGMVSLLILIAAVVYTYIARDKSSSSGNFQNMNKSAGWLLVAGTYSATMVSAVGMVGLPGSSYANGLIVGILNWGSTMAMVLSALFIGPKLRRFGTVTMSEFFEKRFNAPRMKVLTSVITVVGVFSFFCSQLIGSAVILEQMLGLPYVYTVVIAIVIVTVIAFIGGARSVTIMDTIMFVVIALGLGVIFAPSIIHVVGLSNIQTFAQANPDFFAWHGVTNYRMGTLIGLILLWAMGISVTPVNITRAFVAKSNRDWVVGIMVGFSVTFCLVWLMHTSASVIKVVNPDIANATSVLPWAAVNIVPPVVGIFATVALTAACVSTADTQILVISQSIVNDLINKNNRLSDKRVVTLTRVALVLFAVLGFALSAGNAKFIITFGTFGTSLFAAAFFPVVIFGLFSKWVTRAAAYASIIVGIVFDFILQVIPPLFMGKGFGWTGYLPLGIHPVVFATLFSAIALLAVSAVTRPDEKQIACFEAAASISHLEKSGFSDKAMFRCSYALIGFGFVFFAVILALATIV